MYHILVVDDESRIRAIIRKYAEFEGHRVTEATDGMDAVYKCRENTYDMIIMDIMMPKMDGITALKKLREKDAEKYETYIGECQAKIPTKKNPDRVISKKDADDMLIAIGEKIEEE